MKIHLLCPAYRDRESLELLLPHLDSAAESLCNAGHDVALMIVDDGSPDNQPDESLAARLSGRGLKSMELVTLRRNLGHQRAITVGLCRLREREDCDLVVVMDSDGEDRPSDIPRLVQAMVDQEQVDVVFAERTKRTEGLIFKVGYHCYRLSHRFLVGFPIRFGNFSVIRWSALERLVVAQEAWNHYAASIVRLRIPYALVPTERGERLAGKSTMNLEALVIHGLTAMSVFGDRIGVRLLGLSALGAISAAFAILVVVSIRLFTTLAIPGWATFAAGILVLLLVQFGSSSLVFILIVLAGRHGSGFCPRTDYGPFVLRHETLWSVHDS